MRSRHIVVWSKKMMLTRELVAVQLRAIGFGAGDSLILHSSLRSLGWVNGGAAAVVDAVLDCIGFEGTLMVPTFTYTTASFDPLLTPSRTGQVAETVRQRSGAIRSLHPTYSFAAIGKNAAQWLAGHHFRIPVGIDSPLDRLARDGGYVALVGVGHNRDTTIHLGEVYAKVPYLGVPFAPGYDLPSATILLSTGGTLTVDLLTAPGCSRGFGALAPHLYARGKVRVGSVGNAHVELVRAQEVIEAAVTLLRDDPAALLCSDPICEHCPVARQRVRDYADVGHFVVPWGTAE